MDQRSDALVNGALILGGGAAIVDTVIVHWILGFHRLIEGVPDPELFLLEAGVVLGGVVVLSVGAWREHAARR